MEGRKEGWKDGWTDGWPIQWRMVDSWSMLHVLSMRRVLDVLNGHHPATLKPPPSVCVLVSPPTSYHAQLVYRMSLMHTTLPPQAPMHTQPVYWASLMYMPHLKLPHSTCPSMTFTFVLFVMLFLFHLQNSLTQKI